MKSLTQITLILVLVTCATSSFAQTSWSIDVGTPHIGFSYSRGHGSRYISAYVAPSYQYSYRPVYRSYSDCSPSYSYSYSTPSYSYRAPRYNATYYNYPTQYSYSYSAPRCNTTYYSSSPSYSYSNYSYPSYSYSDYSYPSYTYSTRSDYRYPQSTPTYRDYSYRGCRD